MAREPEALSTTKKELLPKAWKVLVEKDTSIANNISQEEFETKLSAYLSSKDKIPQKPTALSSLIVKFAAKALLSVLENGGSPSAALAKLISSVSEDSPDYQKVVERIKSDEQSQQRLGTAWRPSLPVPTRKLRLHSRQSPDETSLALTVKRLEATIDKLEQEQSSLKAKLKVNEETISNLLERNQELKLRLKKLDQQYQFPPPEHEKPETQNYVNRNLFTSLVPKYEVLFDNLNLVPFVEENPMKNLNLTRRQKWGSRGLTSLILIGAIIFLISDYSTITPPAANSFIVGAGVFFVGLQFLLGFSDRQNNLRQDIRVASLLLAVILFFGLISYFKGIALLGSSISILAWLLIPVSFLVYYENIVEHLWKIHSSFNKH